MVTPAQNSTCMERRGAEEPTAQSAGKRDTLTIAQSSGRTDTNRPGPGHGGGGGGCVCL